MRKPKNGTECYQFFAIISLPKELTLKTRGFLRRVTLGFEDRFFFFCSWRPIVGDGCGGAT